MLWSEFHIDGARKLKAHLPSSVWTHGTWRVSQSLDLVKCESVDQTSMNKIYEGSFPISPLQINSERTNQPFHTRCSDGCYRHRQQWTEAQNDKQHQVQWRLQKFFIGVARWGHWKSWGGTSKPKAILNFRNSVMLF